MRSSLPVSQPARSGRVVLNHLNLTLPGEFRVAEDTARFRVREFLCLTVEEILIGSSSSSSSTAHIDKMVSS